MEKLEGLKMNEVMVTFWEWKEHHQKMVVVLLKLEVESGHNWIWHTGAEEFVAVQAFFLAPFANNNSFCQWHGKVFTIPSTAFEAAVLQK